MTHIIEHNTEHTKVAPPKHEIVRRSWNRALNYIMGVLEVFLLFRFLLRLLGANSQSEFAQFIYNITYPFVAPFYNLFPTPSTGGSVLEGYTIVAMIFYAIIFYGIIRLVNLTLYRDTHETIEEKIEEKESV